MTVTGVHTNGDAVSADDDATVDILPVTSDVLVTKTASPNQLDGPGGPVEFSVTVTNTGADTLEVTALSDSVYGNLVGRGDCTTGAILTAGDVYSCRFTENVTGSAPSIHLDTVTAEVTATSGAILYDSARAVVLIFNASSGGGPLRVPVGPLWLLAVVAGLLVMLARGSLGQ